MDERGQAQPIRKRRREIDQVLNRLDGGSGDGQGRVAERFKFRAHSVKTEILEGNGTWRRYATPSRNLSRSGVGVLVGRYIYPGARCRIHLTGLQGRTVTVDGQVVRCRYLPDTGSVYEAGIRFARPIDLGIFHGGASPIELLVADQDESASRQIAHHTRSMNVQLTAVATIEEALERTGSGSYDVVFLDLETPSVGGLKGAGELRARAWGRPLVAMSERPDEDACLQAGFNAVLSKPLDPGEIQQVVLGSKVDPIYSKSHADVTAAGLINDCVEQLGKLVASIEHAFMTRNLSNLDALVRAVHTRAEGAGFEQIAEVAEHTENFLRTDPKRSALRQRLNRLTRLCLAAQPIVPEPVAAEGSAT